MASFYSHKCFHWYLKAPVKQFEWVLTPAFWQCVKTPGVEDVRAGVFEALHWGI